MEPGFSITVTEGDRFVRVAVYGAVTVELARRFSIEANQVGLAHGLNRFLIDVTGAPNTSSVTENYEFAYDDTRKLQLSPNARVAILAAPDDHSHDFVEVVMANSGFFLRIFRDEAAAIVWLEEPAT